MTYDEALLVFLRETLWLIHDAQTLRERAERGKPPRQRRQRRPNPRRRKSPR